jgi:hypothetical protein
LSFAAAQMPVINNVDVAIESDPDSDQGRSGSAGVLSGALGRDDPENGCHGHHDDRRMRTWQGSGRPQQALCRPLTSIALADRAAIEAAVANLE